MMRQLQGCLEDVPEHMKEQAKALIRKFGDDTAGPGLKTEDEVSSRSSEIRPQDERDSPVLSSRRLSHPLSFSSSFTSSTANGRLLEAAARPSTSGSPTRAKGSLPRTGGLVDSWPAAS